MSGGSWDYVYGRFDDVADRLRQSKVPQRRALGSLVALVAKAMHDIEWVDSCDYGPGDDIAAIEAALGPHALERTLEEIERDIIAAHDEARGLLARARGGQ